MRGTGAGPERTDLQRTGRRQNAVNAAVLATRCSGKRRSPQVYFFSAVVSGSTFSFFNSYLVYNYTNLHNVFTFKFTFELLPLFPGVRILRVQASGTETG